MKYMNRISFAVFCLSCFLNILFAQPKGIEHVIIFGIDAMSVDGICTAKTPNLDYIVKNGAYTLHSRGIMPTVSAPGWASILMGAGPEQHAVTSNSWDPADPPFPPVVVQGSYFPSIFTILKARHPEAKTTAIYDWDKFREIIQPQDLDVSVLTKNENETIDAALKDFAERKPDLSFYYFVLVDDAGHAYGHGTAQYYNSITKIDSLLGRLLGYLKDSGLDKTTAVVVVADHGGIEKGHGGESLSEIEIPMLFYGCGISGGYEIKEQVNNYDVASTIAYMLGLKQPDEWVAKPLKSVFNENSGNKSAALVKKPQLSPKGGEFINTSSPINITSNTPGCPVYYTTDGSVPTKGSEKFSSPFTVGKTSLIKAVAIDNEGHSSPLACESFRVIKPGMKENGVKYKYYEGNWTQLPDFSKIAPLRDGTVYGISLDSVKHRKDHFGVVFDGYLEIKAEGEYKFRLCSDDGSSLSIDDSLIVDNDGSHSAYARTGRKILGTGMHKISVRYFDDYDSEIVSVRYEGPGVELQVIPPDVLFITN